MDEPEASPEHACPWCPSYAGALKRVLQHMESAHHRRWCDLALIDTNQTKVTL